MGAGEPSYAGGCPLVSIATQSLVGYTWNISELIFDYVHALCRTMMNLKPKS